MRWNSRLLMLAVASAVVFGCGDATDAGGGDADKLIVDPPALNVSQGASKDVLVRVVDERGAAIESSIRVQLAGPGITVAPAPGYMLGQEGEDGLVFGTFNGELRVLVTGNSLSRHQFTVESQGLSQLVDVTVLPVDFTGTVTGSPGDAATPMKVTAPADFTFGPEARVVDDDGNDVALVYAISDDGATATVYPLPGSPAIAVSFEDIIPVYNPALSLTLPSTLDLELTGTVGAGFAGADDFATAPRIAVPSGSTRGLVDVGVFPIPVNVSGTTRARVYRLDVAEAGLYDVELRWDGSEDLGVFLGAGGCSFDITAADAHGSGGSASPETTGETLGAPLELAAGSYCVGVVIFDLAWQADPETFSLLLRRQ